MKRSRFHGAQGEAQPSRSSLAVTLVLTCPPTAEESYTTLLCMLNRSSRVRLFATLRTVAHQAPLSLGFSRQEHWSGLSFPSSGINPQPRDQTQVSYISCAGMGRQVLSHQCHLGSPTASPPLTVGELVTCKVVSTLPKHVLSHRPGTGQRGVCINKF